MFTDNLLKKAKQDSKRKEAVAYFNSKTPNSPVIEKSGFWSFNRVKILASAFFVFIASCSLLIITDSGIAFLTFLSFVYIIAPILAVIFGKCSLEIIKKVKFVRVANRLYKQSDLPSGVVFSAIFLAIPVGFSLSQMISNFSLTTFAPDMIFSGIILSPFLIYHLLCFIGDHPITIFTAINYQTDKALARFQGGHNVQYNHSYQSSHTASTFSDDYVPGMPSATSRACAYSSLCGTPLSFDNGIDNRQ
jgi:hypothetical protein